MALLNKTNFTLLFCTVLLHFLELCYVYSHACVDLCSYISFLSLYCTFTILGVMFCVFSCLCCSMYSHACVDLCSYISFLSLYCTFTILGVMFCVFSCSYIRSKPLKDVQEGHDFVSVYNIVINICCCHIIYTYIKYKNTSEILGDKYTIGYLFFHVTSDM